MGREYDGIDDRLADWMGRQHVFFVATAPLSGDGHVNLSPKGLDTFRVLDRRTVAWLDLTGSGAETIAHLRENGRITMMFCAFDGPPRIVRLHGTGSVHRAGSGRFADLSALFPDYTGARSVITVEVRRVADSCGYGVPRLRFDGERDQLLGWADRKGADGIVSYWEEKNAVSLDGLPALTGDADAAARDSGVTGTDG